MNLFIDVIIQVLIVSYCTLHWHSGMYILLFMHMGFCFVVWSSGCNSRRHATFLRSVTLLKNPQAVCGNVLIQHPGINHDQFKLGPFIGQIVGRRKKTTKSFVTGPRPVSAVVERSPGMWELGGSIPGRVKQRR